MKRKPKNEKDANADVKVKICGITSASDAELARRLGAWAVGFIFYPPSPRYITPDACAGISASLGSSVHKVGVFVDASFSEVVETARRAQLTIVQLHGNEDRLFAEKLRPHFQDVWKAVRIGEKSPVELFDAFDGFTLLLDAYMKGKPGGTGRTFCWELVKDVAAERPVVLAGGLEPGNVGKAVSVVKPFGVDISSGVESSPGKKDHRLLKRLFEALE